MKYLLDTNILSEPLRPSPHPKILMALQSHGEDCATASIVWHELCYGCERLEAGRKKQHIQDYLQNVIFKTLPILPYCPQAARWHAQQRARLEALGLKPPFADGQIAAIAKVNQLVLVTRNIADYAHFELEMIDWGA